MPRIDYSHLSTRERLDLIGEIGDSIEAETVPLTLAQAAEIDRRLETLDEDIKQGRDAYGVFSDLTANYR
jgi:putative addiction module component (TIGR02574 family)